MEDIAQIKIFNSTILSDYFAEWLYVASADRQDQRSPHWLHVEQGRGPMIRNANVMQYLERCLLSSRLYLISQATKRKKR